MVFGGIYKGIFYKTANFSSTFTDQIDVTLSVEGTARAPITSHKLSKVEQVKITDYRQIISKMTHTWPLRRVRGLPFQHSSHNMSTKPSVLTVSAVLAVKKKQKRKY